MNHADTQPEREPAASAPQQARGKFIWPPRPIQVPAHDDDHGHVVELAAADSVPLSLWERIEREWFGVVTPPLVRRLADAGAAPDSIDSYCWRCGRTVGPYETDAHGCSKCRGSRPHWDRFVRLAEYAKPWDRIVQDVKFTKWPRLGVDLGHELGRQIARATPDLADRPTVVVPVPTNYFRRLTRGTDHSLNLARGVAVELGLPLRKLLTRARRPEQARLPASDRLTNLRNSMRRSTFDPLWVTLGLGKGSKWPNHADSARLILVDDISTTGATMSEAARTVKEIRKVLNIKDLEIIAATVCRTEER